MPGVGLCRHKMINTNIIKFLQKKKKGKKLLSKSASWCFSIHTFSHCGKGKRIEARDKQICTIISTIIIQHYANCFASNRGYFQ